MKKIIYIAALLIALASAPATRATSGCGLSVMPNIKITAQYGITISVFQQNGYIIIPPGASFGASLSDGDLVLVQASNYSCGSLSELPWGFTVWTHCGESGAPAAIVMAGDFTMDWYVAREMCACPAPGYGMLVDTYSGYQCQQLVPPSQK